ncbi:MAG: methyltransferase domain-containing protein [Actinomycetia bacterium]|nr:methyltransferase domain-containing protein [Actinomycetes bacterium]MCP4960668.1 methyltransferase domain-containing protein [Actinomycetes bacterium]
MSEATRRITACPACDGANLELVATEDQIPTNSCLLLESRDEAEGYPRGDMALTFCQDCGFLFNADFDATLSEYSARYEETQGYSARFVEFARDLASSWVDKYDLAGKNVLEIGCGSMGEFLQFMVDAGAGKGIGIDPALNVERIEHETPDKFEWIPDFYSERYTHLQADAVVCRHTLEHISPVKEFMEMVRRSIGDRPDTIVLFELPDVRRVLNEVAFWDVYYEHCSYFSLGSLARLFRLTGFEVLHIELDYDDQYLLIEARPSTVPAAGDPLPLEDDMDGLTAGVETYRVDYARTLEHWGEEFENLAAVGGKPVIWGAGSKGVSFLTNLGTEAIEFAVDINPTKHGFFMAGTGQQIVGPEFLAEYQPQLVVAMNPIYVEEIRNDLDRLGVSARLTSV